MTMAHAPLYPLKFEPIYQEKVWGGRALEKLGRSLPGDGQRPIGESWELADLNATAASGGGGDAARSVVRNGPLAGETLHDLLAARGRELCGGLPLNEAGAFPLLVKFLDARQNLSVQVHPSPVYAREHPEAHIKHEAWYVVDAEPGAVIYKGVQEGVTADQFREALESGRLEPLLLEEPVQPGQCHYLPSGTCHALGAGVVVAEVQTPSDTTFRVYDWGRTGRELHVEEALASMHLRPPETEAYELNASVKGKRHVIRRLVRCPYFGIDRYDAPAAFEERLQPGEPTIWMWLSGQARLEGPDGPTDLGPGETVLLPANLQDTALRVVGAAQWLEVTFPQAAKTQLA
jgi:mannose-6-phosphate isomerase